jgi:hypothetical protein
VAVTWNPLGLFLGRLSANLEAQLAPHHAVVLSPNALLFGTDRGSLHSVLSEGFGFATSSSLGFGGELGYHYGWSGPGALHGPFFGPSLLMGVTTRASVGNASRAQPYLGLALDLGTQEIIYERFIAGAGVGLGVVHMAGTTAVAPRFLCQLGWTF